MIKYSYVRPFADVLKEPEHLDYETRVTEDTYVSIKDQVDRFMSAKIPLKGREAYDYEFGASDEDSITSNCIYGGDPVDIQQQMDSVQSFYADKQSKVVKETKETTNQPEKEDLSENA